MHEPTEQMCSSAYLDVSVFPVDELYDVAKSALFQDPPQPQPDEDVAFWLVELHVIDGEKETESPGNGFKEHNLHTYRVFTHTGNLSQMQDEMCGTKKCYPASSADKALRIYAKHFSTFSKFHKTRKILSRWIGSPVYRKQSLEKGLTDGPVISEEVNRLVEYLWREAMGELREILSVPYRKIAIKKVKQAEGVLLTVRKVLDGEGLESTELPKLTQEFYQLIPHKPYHEAPLADKRILAKKQELCQLIHDIVNVSEATDWSQRSSSQSRYRALQCYLECLAPNHPEYIKVKQLVDSTISSEDPVEIKRIFAASRGVEEAAFARDLGNEKFLFHSSRPANFLGILSRGILLPKIVVEMFGGSRRDAGMLGSGIYFGDRVSTAQQYSSPSQMTGTRLMIVNKVALGNVKDLYEFDLSLEEAPNGYHSTHGISRTETRKSQFKDDEYVVYEASQQCIRYLVEFTLPEDAEMDLPMCETPLIEQESEIIFCEQAQVESSAPPIDTGVDDVTCLRDPIAGIDAGLVDANKTSDTITLQAVHIRAKLMDHTAQVVVLQSYRNNSDESLEAKYVFPVDETAAVCGFEAFINNKHVVGIVKEKETAHKEYREAIQQGHGAYLMDEEAPNVFSVSIGNLPARSEVLIKITYVTELAVEGNKLAFNLLGTVSPWKRQEVFAKGTPTSGDAVDVELETAYKEQSVQIAVTMASKIISVESPTHSVLFKQKDKEASITLGKDCNLDDGFQLLIGVEGMHKPRMWIEETLGDVKQAAMLVFYPEFDVGKLEPSEMVLVLDSSNSMKGEVLEEAKKVMVLVLQCLPARCMFNVIVFGTEFDELFPSSQPKTKVNLKAAKEFIMAANAVQGCTDFWRPLQSNNLLKPSCTMRNMFVITDGHLSNEEATLKAAMRHRATTRLFTFGISKAANRHLLAAIARHGGGAFEFFNSKAKSTWEKKVKLQISRAKQPAVTSLKVTWHQSDPTQPPPLQAPVEITSLFRNDRLLVYGLVENCQGVTLTADISGKRIEMELSGLNQSKTTGNMLHQLTARAIIRNWEEGVLHSKPTVHESQKSEMKTRIVELSTQHSIVTSFTSFIAVEERDLEEQQQISEGSIPDAAPSLKKLLEGEDVDQLTSLQWVGPHAAKDKDTSPLNKVGNLLNTAKRAADYLAYKSAEKYFEEAYELATGTLSYAQPITLQVVHSFSKFCARVKHDMSRAFQVVSGVFQEIEKREHELLEDKDAEREADTAQLDELEALQEAVEWAKTCEIEMKRQAQTSKPTSQPGTKQYKSDDESSYEPQEILESESDDEMVMTLQTTRLSVKEEICMPRPVRLKGYEGERREMSVGRVEMEYYIDEANFEPIPLKPDEVLESYGREACLKPDKPVLYEAKLEPIPLEPDEDLKPYGALEPYGAREEPSEPSEPLTDLKDTMKAKAPTPDKMKKKKTTFGLPSLKLGLPSLKLRLSSSKKKSQMRDAPILDSDAAGPDPSDAGGPSPPSLPGRGVLHHKKRQRPQPPSPTFERIRSGSRPASVGMPSCPPPALAPIGMSYIPPAPGGMSYPPHPPAPRGMSPPPPPPPALIGIPSSPSPLAVQEVGYSDEEEYGGEDEFPIESVEMEAPLHIPDSTRLVELQHPDGSWTFQTELEEMFGTNRQKTEKYLREKLDPVLSEQGVTATQAQWEMILQLMATVLACCCLKAALAQIDVSRGNARRVSMAQQKGEAFILKSTKRLKEIMGLQLDWEAFGKELYSSKQEMVVRP